LELEFRENSLANFKSKAKGTLKSQNGEITVCAIIIIISLSGEPDLYACQKTGNPVKKRELILTCLHSLGVLLPEYRDHNN
jgi:hypothetical protein